MTLSVADILERTQWDFFWAPPDATVVERAELLYVCCPRDVPLLNCATRTRAPAEHLPRVVQEVSGAHRGVRSRWLVREDLAAAPLEGALERAGYALAVETQARAIDVTADIARSSSTHLVRRVSTMDELRDCTAVIDAAFGDSRLFTEEELRLDLERCTGPDARVERYVAYSRGSGRPVASGGLTLFPELRFGLLWAGGTVPDERGRGAYSAVVTARIARARQLGCSHVGLYAIAETSAPIVARQGFVHHGTMAYWERPPGAA